MWSIWKRRPTDRVSALSILSLVVMVISPSFCQDVLTRTNTAYHDFSPLLALQSSVSTQRPGQSCSCPQLETLWAMAAMLLTVLSLALLAAANLIHGAAFISMPKEMTIRYAYFFSWHITESCALNSNMVETRRFKRRGKWGVGCPEADALFSIDS